MYYITGQLSSRNAKIKINVPFLRFLSTLLGNVVLQWLNSLG